MSFYICDPKKHKKCRRGSLCQKWCILTTVSAYSTDGRALTEEEVEEKENELRARVEPDLKIGRNTGTQEQRTTAAEEEPDTELDARPEAPAAAEEADE